MIPVVIYRLALWAYTLGVRIASLFNPKAKLFIQGRRELLANIKYALLNEQRSRIWMHCASLGEFEQGRPVLEQLRKKYPGHAIVLTFFSPSGYEIRKNYDGADYVFYLPIDSPGNAKQFLNIVQPSLCLFVKYDLWYFYLSKIAEKNIPLLLISAIFRKEQVFFKWYGGLHKRMLQCFTHIFVQDARSEQMLNRIGIEQVSIGGDTRFDRVAEAIKNVDTLPIADTFCKDHKIIVAGSTWADDESLLKTALDELPAEWKLIIVPHEVHDAHIQQLNSLFENNAVLWTSYKETDANKRVLIVNSIGVLLKLYQYADVTYIGGGFNNSGIHNILEAAVYGKPVMHGPVYDKFREARELLNLGGSVVVKESRDAVQAIKDWQQDIDAYKNACSISRKYVADNTGATQKILNYIDGKKLLIRL